MKGYQWIHKFTEDQMDDYDAFIKILEDRTIEYTTFERPWACKYCEGIFLLVKQKDYKRAKGLWYKLKK